MADAWSTTVTREPEFDDYTQSQVMALAAYEAGQCPNCHNYDCLVPLKTDTRHVTWAQHGGQKFAVLQYRCLACGAADLIRRDWSTQHEKDKPVRGQALAADGRMFVSRPLTEEE
jgi:hypothetical protein